jgi:signal transduction histidine kinase
MFDFFQKLFESKGFMPHGHCYLWQPDVLWTHVAGDVLTVTSYFMIPVGLVIFMTRRKDLQFKEVFLLFGAFILSCGFTHLIDVITIWIPLYRLESLAKLLTGLVSLATAVMLFRIIPIALKIPSLQVVEHQRHLLSAGESVSQSSSWIWDRTKEELEVSAQFFQIWELRPEEIPANAPWKIAMSKVHPDEQEKVHDMLQGAFLPEGKNKIEFRIKSTGNYWKWVQLIVAQQLEENKWLGVVSDITERKKIELEKMRSLIQERENAEQSVYIASHDLQEPLRTITNYSTILHESYAEQMDDLGKTSFQFILSACERMQELIMALLQHSRLGLKAKREEVNTQELMKDLLEDIDHLIQETGAEIEVGSLPVLAAYPVELSMLFRNLITNAIKFQKKGIPPRIQVSARAASGSWVFSVSDNGIGIESPYLTKIFTIFQRLHTQQEYPGTGIGLAHCKKIVELHGGRIRVTSTLGEGSCFSFSLPIKPI